MKIKELFKSSKNWTKHYFASDKNNKWIDENSDKAVRFCLTGAIKKCYKKNQEGEKIYSKVLNYIKEKYGYVSVVSFNDDARTKFKDIKKLVTELDI